MHVRRISLAALAAGCLVAVAAARSAATTPIQLGVLGDPARFDGQTKQASTTRLIIVGWDQGTGASYFSRLFATMLPEPMVGLSTGPEGGPESISPEAIARGQGDAVLVALNQAVAAWKRPIYVRPLAEMNGHWNAYSAYNTNGSLRSADHSTAAFKKAFARIYLIVHGGTSVNARLRSLGLPPVSAPTTPAPNALVVWNPQGYGSPDLPGNSAQAYYPGDRYVDVVADDLYDIGGKAEWPATEALYAAHPSKPFAIGEWGLWGVDDPAFVAKMASFLRTHRRTVLAVYYSGRPGSVFDLATKPRSLAAYRRLIAPLGA
jgi:hypothetical protein